MKVDTTGIEFLEGDGLGKPVKEIVTNGALREAKPYKAYKMRVKATKPIKQPVRSLQDTSSFRLVRELTHRHYKVVFSCLFWMGVGAVIVLWGVK